MARKKHEHDLGEEARAETRRPASPGEDGSDARIRELEARVAELEQQRSLEREQLLALIDSLPDDVFFVDRGGDLVLVNQAARSNLGLSARDALWRVDDGERLFEVYKPDGQRRRPDESPFVAALAGEVVRGEEMLRDLRTGELRHREYQVTPVRVQGRIVGAVSAVRDVTDRQRAEEALRESEDRFRSLFEHLLDGFAYCRMIHDEQGRPVDFVYLDVNEAFTRLTGLRDVVGKRVTEVIPGIRELNPELFEIYDRVAAGGPPERLEVDFKPLRKVLTISVYSPKAQHFVAVFDDITDRRRAEEALRQSKEDLERRVAERTAELRTIGERLEAERQRFLGVLDTLPVIVDLLSPDYRVVWANQAYREALGDNVGRLCYASQFGRNAPCEECQAFQPLKTGRSQHWEWTLPNGRIFEIHNYPITDTDGTPLILEMDIDITERRQAELALKQLNQTLERTVEARTAELRASEERYRAIVETAEEGIATHEPDGTISYVNQRMADMLGYSREELIGRSSLDFVLDEERDSVIAARESLRDRPSFSKERKLRRKDGSTLWTLGNVWARRDGAGQLRGYLAMHTDITERKRADDALREANARLQEADRQKNEFISVLSHELRNPLAPIRNCLYLLDRAGGLNDRGRGAAKVIDRQVNHLTRLIDDLLDVTRISKGKIRLQETRVDLRDVVSRTVEDLQSVLDGHRVSVAMPQERVGVRGDPVRLAQVLANLLSNAVKFTPRGERIDVRLTAEDGKAHLQVEDAGTGIEPQMLSRLFTPFVQADHTLDRSHGGLGLGLALAKGLVELHGGTIRAHSAGLGRGSRFHVELPLEQRSGSVVGAGAPAPRGKPVSRRILVVEDNRDAAESLHDVLELEGHVVAMALSGADGVESARTFAPEIILCDVGLPGMDGYAVAQALRREPDGGRYYLIAMTGYAQPEDVMRAQNAGFNAHLAKPPDLGALARLIAEAPVGVDEVPSA